MAGGVVGEGAVEGVAEGVEDRCCGVRKDGSVVVVQAKLEAGQGCFCSWCLRRVV